LVQAGDWGAGGGNHVARQPDVSASVPNTGNIGVGAAGEAPAVFPDVGEKQVAERRVGETSRTAQTTASRIFSS
jgi:hypothetical protein